MCDKHFAVLVFTLQPTEQVLPDQVLQPGGERLRRLPAGTGPLPSLLKREPKIQRIPLGLLEHREDMLLLIG